MKIRIEIDTKKVGRFVKRHGEAITVGVLMAIMMHHQTTKMDKTKDRHYR